MKINSSLGLFHIYICTLSWKNTLKSTLTLPPATARPRTRGFAPSIQTATMTIVELHMNIDCDGCEENVRKALLKLEGVHYVNVDRLHGKVTVTGSTSQKKVLRAARRTGRLAVLWPSAYNHAYAQPAYYYDQSYLAAAHAPQHHRHYDNAAGTRKNGGVSAVGRRPVAQQYHKASSYNYHVHGYFDSDLYGNHHEQQPDVVPAAVRNYFSDENPSACSIM